MSDEFLTHLLTLNYPWIVGALIFGFFGGKTFGAGMPIWSALGYVGFVFPTMKISDLVQTLGLTAEFARAAQGWGIAPWDLSSAIVAAIAVAISAVFWALNQ